MPIIFGIYFLRNELLGLEGMVTRTNPDDAVLVVVSVPGNSNGTLVSSDPTTVPTSVSFENEKRYVIQTRLMLHLCSITFHLAQSSDDSVSNAPHRSLPDIPVSEPHASLSVAVVSGPLAGADNGSDLYATVGDKPPSDEHNKDHHHHLQQHQDQRSRKCC